MEGSLRGEGGLKYVKPKLTSIHCKHWRKNTHNKLLEEVSLDMVVEDYTTQHENYHIMKNKRLERRPKCIIYMIR